MPQAPATDLVLLYVGEILLPTAQDRAEYPELRTYPAVELAALKLRAGGKRTVALSPIAPGLAGFSTYRVQATVEQPTPGVTILRAVATVPRGPYAFSCGAVAYEVNAR